MTVAMMKNKEDLGPPDLEEFKAGPEPDRREEGDHEGIAQRRVECKRGQAVTAGDENREGDDQASHDGRGDIVARQGTDPAAEAVADEQDDAREGDSLDKVEVEHVPPPGRAISGGRGFPAAFPDEINGDAERDQG